MTRKPMKWSDMDPQDESPREDAMHPVNALPRIGDTPDGEVLQKLLISKVMAPPPDGADFGTLSKFEGERKFARTLLNLLNGKTENERHANRRTEDRGRDTSA